MMMLAGAAGACGPGDRAGGTDDAPPSIDARTCPPGMAVFDPRVEPYAFEVPEGCTVIEAKLWGGGGGGGSGEIGGLHASRGGGGGFARATLSVTPGQRLLIGVATGGEGAPLSGGYGYAGGGGGATMISHGAELLLIAGGGGGGGSAGCADCEGHVGSGGAGGGEAGLDGATAAVCGTGEPVATGGGGGGAAAGGVAGTGTSGGRPGTSLTGGSSFGYVGIADGGRGHLGGTSSALNGAGGGGGAGWFGGGGGGYTVTYCGGGGGGGSSYAASAARTAELWPGTDAMPGRPDDPDHANDAGVGAGPGMSGAGGRAVILH